MIETLNALILVTFLFLLGLGTTTTVIRGLRFMAVGIPLPQLLVRDIISKLGLAVPLVLIFSVRWLLGSTASLSGNLLWVLVTSLPALIGVGVYCYYELVILDGPLPLTRRDRNQLAVIETKIDENTLVSKEAFHEANTVNQKIAALKEQFDELVELTLVANRRRDAVIDARNAVVDAREAARDSVRDVDPDAPSG